MAGEHAPFIGCGIRDFRFVHQRYNDYPRGYGIGGSCGMYEYLDMPDRDSLSRKSLACVEDPEGNLLC